MIISIAAADCTEAVKMTMAYDAERFVVESRPQTHETKRLSLLNTGCRLRNVKWPSFDPRELRPGILHFGCGAFHRAHQNIFTQRAIEMERSSRSSWGVVGVGFRRREIQQLLAPQDFLYTVLERGPEDTTAEVVGVLRDHLFAKDQRAEVIAALKNPEIRIVTLTVTPSGYSEDSPDRETRAGRSPDAIGLLVAGLAGVRAQGTRPPVLISCDNMPRNGRRLREALIRRAEVCDPSLGKWISQNVQCPSSVVDRIVPVPTRQDGAEARGLLGVYDFAAVATEPYRQWVMEDFDGPRPRWELAGAKFVADVSRWEASKLSLLNGTHMAIAYLGILTGLETVSDCVLDPLLARYASRLMLDEQVPTIPTSDHDLVSYSGQLLERWRNVNMMHQLQRIARNGSEKLESRLLCSLVKNMSAGRPAPCTMLAVAAWVCCTGRLMPFDCNIEDSAGPTLEQLAAASGGDTGRLVKSLLCRRDIFGGTLPDAPAFRDELIQAVECLTMNGARGALSRVVSAPRGSSS
jgi:fructuronate reductase